MASKRLTLLRQAGFFTQVGIFAVVNLGLQAFIVVQRIDFAWWYAVPIVWGVGLLVWGAWLLWAAAHGMLDGDSRFEAVKMARRSPW